MKNKFLILVLVMLIASLVAAGCDRPAPLPATVPTSTIPFPVSNRPTIISEIGTQTAIAQTPPVVAITATPVPGQVVQPTQPPAQATQKPVATKAPRRLRFHCTRALPR